MSPCSGSLSVDTEGHSGISKACRSVLPFCDDGEDSYSCRSAPIKTEPNQESDACLFYDSGKAAR
jgi:hypothetical protein